MSTLDDEYADRLADLLEDMEGDGVDSVQMMMSWVAGYVQGRMEGQEAEAYLYQFEDADMLIQITDPEEINAARLH
ncbi:hypothetical protein KVQ01_11315 [Escherichia coli]|uniref:hypothetical protein n=1 Tax=Escherichia coli TaxID=562 RepID=UPI001F063D51|nr:hypothetical protein [Escherichia coli]MCH0685608.1 hypothetical protein [Escherichia coli]MDZ8667108.1 hypothetical protein [Escherichia coli]WRX87690.1 hypothetical protein SM938_22445 [Escherichia coli]